MRAVQSRAYGPGARGSKQLLCDGLAGLLVAAAVFLIVWSQRSGGLPMYDHTVIARFPHDAEAYSQGLLFHGGSLYESTGRYETSSVRKVAVETGEVLMRHDLPSTLFGEGLALHDGRLYQLTWTSGLARVYSLEDLALVEQLNYDGEGWGLTSDGTHLILSDGTDLLRFMDPKTFEEVRRIRVRVDNQPVEYLNELEWVDGEIWANVWKADYIARIDPGDGKLLGWIDLTGLFDYTSLPDAEAVLNGIAHDPESGRVFVTGKLWPWLFEIRISRR